LQFLDERLDAGFFGSVFCKGLKHADAADTLILLRVRGEWEGDSTA
jgi:hypothetical protein